MGLDYGGARIGAGVLSASYMEQQEQDLVLGREVRVPITGQPDFYELKLGYRPKAYLIESKSLKLYLWGFREVGIFAEDLAATLLADLAGACDPSEMTVDLTQQVRGGLKIRTVVRHRGEPTEGP